MTTNTRVHRLARQHAGQDGKQPARAPNLPTAKRPRQNHSMMVPPNKCYATGHDAQQGGCSGTITGSRTQGAGNGIAGSKRVRQGIQVMTRGMRWWASALVEPSVQTRTLDPLSSGSHRAGILDHLARVA